jgi:hypothetical protein
VSPLTFVDPPVDPRPNVLLYGPPKSGKTAAAASAPGRVLYLNVDLPNAIHYANEQHNDDGRIFYAGFEGLGTLVDIFKAAESGDWDVVVADPIGDLYRRLLAVSSNDAIRPTLNQYGDVGVHLERWCRGMCELPTVSFIIVGHEFPIEDESTGQVDRLVWTGTKSGSASLSQKLMGMVDIVGYCGVAPQEDGSAKYLATLVNEGGRRGGDRFATLGRWEELDLADWFERINHGAQAAPDAQEATAT